MKKNPLNFNNIICFLFQFKCSWPSLLTNFVSQRLVKVKTFFLLIGHSGPPKAPQGMMMMIMHNIKQIHDDDFTGIQFDMKCHAFLDVSLGGEIDPLDLEN